MAWLALGLGGVVVSFLCLVRHPTFLKRVRPGCPRKARVRRLAPRRQAKALGILVAHHHQRANDVVDKYPCNQGIRELVKVVRVERAGSLGDRTKRGLIVAKEGSKLIIDLTHPAFECRPLKVGDVEPVEKRRDLEVACHGQP